MLKEKLNSVVPDAKLFFLTFKLNILSNFIRQFNYEENVHN